MTSASPNFGESKHRIVDQLSGVSQPLIFPGTAADAARMAARRHERISAKKSLAATPVGDLRAQAKAAGVAGAGRMSKADLVSRLSRVAPPAVGAPAPMTMLAAGGRYALNHALPISIAGAALVAGVSKARAGGTAGETAIASTKAAGRLALPAAVVGGSLYGLAQVAPRAARVATSVLTKAALPLTLAIAAAGAVGGYRKTGTAYGAVLGAADTLTGGAASYFATNGGKMAMAYLNPAAAKKDTPAAERPSGERRLAQAAPAYKDTWSDSRGRSYTRQNFDVRKPA